MLYEQTGSGAHLGHGTIEHQAQRMHIGLAPLGCCRRQELDLLWGKQRIAQILGLVVDQRAYRPHDINAIRHPVIYIHQRLSSLKGHILADILYIDFQLLRHSIVYVLLKHGSNITKIGDTLPRSVSKNFA